MPLQLVCSRYKPWCAQVYITAAWVLCITTHRLSPAFHMRGMALSGLTVGGPALGLTKPCVAVLEEMKGMHELTEANACAEAWDQTLLGTPAAVETAAPNAAASALGELVSAVAVACSQESVLCQTSGGEMAAFRQTVCLCVGCDELSGVGPVQAGICGCPWLWKQQAWLPSSEPKPTLSAHHAAALGVAC